MSNHDKLYVQHLVLQIWRKHFLRKNQIAKKLGVSPTTLRNWENGRHKAPASGVYFLESLLEVDKVDKC